MVEERALTTPALQDAISPIFVALQGRWINSEGPLESASDEYIVAKQSLTTS